MDRNKGGVRGGNKDVNKPEDIISLHLADGHDDDSSDNKYSDDNDELVELFEFFKDLNDWKSSDKDVYIADTPIVTSELVNNNKDDDDITEGNGDGNNNDKDSNNDNYSNDSNSEDSG